MITNSESGTRIDEIAERIFRINTPVSTPGGSFSFNQFLILDDEPLLFHTGPAALFPVVKEAVDAIVPVVNLRFIGFSHFEADECGALNQFLGGAASAVPVCGRIAAMTSVSDYASRPPKVLHDHEELCLGGRRLRWFETPHLPHSWDSGLMMDLSTRTLFCSDLFTQGGSGETAVISGDVLGASEAFRGGMNYLANSPDTAALLGLLAEQHPRTLACMHGSAWSGDGAMALHGLRQCLGAAPRHTAVAPVGKQ